MFSEEPPTPRGSAECQMNAARAQRKAEWFSHDSTINMATTTGSTIGQQNGSKPGRAAAGLSSDEMKEHPINIKKTYWGRGHENTWYKYGADYKDDVIGRPTSARNVRSTHDEGTAIKNKYRANDSSSWFKHEHKDGSPAPPMSHRPQSRLGAETPDSPLWADRAPAKKAAQPRTGKAQRGDLDKIKAKDKAGSINDWFNQDPTPRTDEKIKKRSNKLHNESSTWFQHPEPAKDNGKSEDKKPVKKSATIIEKFIKESQTNGEDTANATSSKEATEAVSHGKAADENTSNAAANTSSPAAENNNKSSEAAAHTSNPVTENVNKNSEAAATKLNTEVVNEPNGTETK